ncbi:hypothetical protein DFJ73DRAFT_29240 [Zopfochytrium polystomum]|nr:hypothetical protein DFJ73DRAFT_29240 [Zopfochytrium polystomum]
MTSPNLPPTIRQVLLGASKTAAATTATKGRAPPVPAVVHGWVRTVRVQKSVAFVEVADGSTSTGLQAVMPPGLAKDLSTGSSIKLHGNLVTSIGANQKSELKVTSIEVLGSSDAESYPLHKARLPLDHLRQFPHFRSRAKTFGAIWRVRNAATLGFHQYFQENGFLHVHPPVLTSNDCEGAGEVFRVFSEEAFQELVREDSNHPECADSPLREAADIAAVESSRSRKEFFHTPSYLTVSTQLHLEAMASSLGRVYALSPTFRAEKSLSTRHLAEFWMLEAEASFISNVDQLARIVEHSLKAATSKVLNDCEEDLSLLAKLASSEIPGTAVDVLERLKRLSESSFACLSYTDAISALERSGRHWQYPVKWGHPLQSEHEKYLAEVYVKGPVFVTHYPSAIKPFYMRESRFSDEKLRLGEGSMTVECFDLLVPGIGELVGGSLREEQLDRLEKRMAEHNVDTSALRWYLDLRRYGSVPHGGFGIGFERYLAYMTGVANIRDLIPYPRWYGHCDS